MAKAKSEVNVVKEEAKIEPEKDQYTTTKSLGIDISKHSLDPKATEKQLTEQELNKVPAIKITQLAKGDRLVQCKPKITGRVYFGNKWYSYKAGEELPLPKSLKDYLHSHGVLDII